jgi:hypothetical protein
LTRTTDEQGNPYFRMGIKRIIGGREVTSSIYYNAKDIGSSTLEEALTIRKEDTPIEMQNKLDYIYGNEAIQAFNQLRGNPLPNGEKIFVNDMTFVFEGGKPILYPFGINNETRYENPREIVLFLTRALQPKNE